MHASCCSRRQFLTRTAVGGLGLTMVGAAADVPQLGQKRLWADEPACPVPGVRQLLDDLEVQSSNGLSRVMHQAVKHPDPVVRNEHSWEAKRAQIQGSVLYRPDLGQYQMWYLAWTDDKIVNFDRNTLNGRPISSSSSLTAYATSKDGIHWDKPNLGQLNFNTADNGLVGNNNLVDVGRVNRESFTVIYNPNSPAPQDRYHATFFDHSIGIVGPNDPSGRWPYPQKTADGRGVYWFAPDLGDGMWVASSPDGVHWTNDPRNPLVTTDCTSDSIVWDPKLKMYVGYGRGAGNCGRRATARRTSQDLIHWSNPQVVFQADGQDYARAQTISPNSNADCQVEGTCTCIYEGHYIGLPYIRYTTHDNSGKEGAWTTEIQMIHSHDGINWTRMGNRAPVLSVGKPGSWDDTIVKLAANPVVTDDKILLYYSGYDQAGTVQIGLAALRRDGWVSLDAGREPGTLVTKPLVLPEGSLRINTDASRGEVRVALIDDSGKVLTESEPIRGDQLRAKVKLRGSMPKPGTPVRLEFTVRNAKLYSYWFEQRGDSK